MMNRNTYIYLAVMAAGTYLVRVLPLTLFRKQVKNSFVQSFLYYMPYATLAVMTFPAIMETTQAPWVGLIALCAGIGLAWFGAGLFPVAIACCIVVYLLELMV